MGMTARQLKKNIVDILNGAGIHPAPFNADMLIEHLAGITKLKLLTDGETVVSAETAKKVTDAAIKCSEGFPLQHIIGHCEFMGLRFKVNSDVLIPRPDTETLVTETLSQAKNLHGNLKVLDMCTGSGCIAITISHFLNSAEIHASDISEKALITAKENAVQNNSDKDIIFHHGSFFEPFSPDEKFDIIVSNPPYIPTKDIKELSDEVRLHEPIQALDGGEDGLMAYRKIISVAPKHLKSGGLLLFEVGINQSDDVKELLSKEFTDIGSVRDYGGIERVIYGKLI